MYLGQLIRKRILDATGLTASCGISCNKMLSKICSDINKPDGISYLEFNQKAVDDFIS